MGVIPGISFTMILKGVCLCVFSSCVYHTDLMAKLTYNWTFSKHILTSDSTFCSVKRERDTYISPTNE